MAGIASVKRSALLSGNCHCSSGNGLCQIEIQTGQSDFFSDSALSCSGANTSRAGVECNVGVCCTKSVQQPLQCSMGCSREFSASNKTPSRSQPLLCHFFRTRCSKSHIVFNDSVLFPEKIHIIYLLFPAADNTARIL